MCLYERLNAIDFIQKSIRPCLDTVLQLLNPVRSYEENYYVASVNPELHVYEYKLGMMLETKSCFCHATVEPIILQLHVSLTWQKHSS